MQGPLALLAPLFRLTQSIMQKIMRHNERQNSHDQLRTMSFSYYCYYYIYHPCKVNFHPRIRNKQKSFRKKSKLTCRPMHGILTHVGLASLLCLTVAGHLSFLTYYHIFGDCCHVRCIGPIGKSIMINKMWFCCKNVAKTYMRTSLVYKNFLGVTPRTPIKGVHHWFSHPQLRATLKVGNPMVASLV
jgi:hypothetical protein